MTMGDLFDALGALGRSLEANSKPYEDRKVGLYEEGGMGISTAEVFDGSQPFETAVLHPEYDNGKIIIVEAYDTFEQAVEGHQKWINIMTTEPLPMELVDCCNNELSKINKRIGNRMVFPRTIDGFFVAEEPKQLPEGDKNEH